MDLTELHIALVDDEAEVRKNLSGYLQRAAADAGVSCRIDAFSNAVDFLRDYSPSWDLVFLDIEMPELDGMEAARQLRKLDQRMGIIFVTNMAQYALRGYEVNAIDFIVKPVEYFTFSYKFQKALQFCARRREKELILATEDGFVRMPYSGIRYLEKDKNYIVYHTGQGAFRARGTMSQQEEQLQADGFARCNSGCMVNLRHVTRVNQDTVWVEGTALPVSRQRRKGFVDSLMRYWGQ